MRWLFFLELGNLRGRPFVVSTVLLVVTTSGRGKGIPGRLRTNPTVTP
jgi:hypothetical protein